MDEEGLRRPPGFGSSFAATEDPLPRFGLIDCATRDRTVDEEGWDVVRVAHRRDEKRGGELMVGVIRRATARRAGDRVRVPVPDSHARKSVATVLALPRSKTGREAIEVAVRIAHDDGAWHERKIIADGLTVTGYETEYDNMWVAYFLTDSLIVYVLADASSRAVPLKLKTLDIDEVRARAG
jgi:hypothetical protein